MRQQAFAMGLERKRKPFPGSVKSQAQSRCTQSPAAGQGHAMLHQQALVAALGGKTGPGTKEEQVGGGGVRLMLIFRMAGRSVCCILSDGICASRPCGSSA